MRADEPELGSDQLDLALGRVDRPWRFVPRRSPALGVATLGSPALVYVLLGAALGPSGLNVFTDAMLGEAQTIAWVSLAVLGVFVGLGLHTEISDALRPTLSMGALLGVITAATISGGLLLELRYLAAPRPDLLPSPLCASALLIGMCAAVSGAVHPRRHATTEFRTAASLANVDDLPLVLAGTVLVAALSVPPLFGRLGATVLCGAAVGLAGWLLFDRADDAERGLYVAGAVLLLAGIGAYLGTSPLLAGWSAAMMWVRLPGEADRITARDLRPLQHPLVALLLIIAGALTRWSPLVMWVSAFVVVLRIGAKLVATLAVHRFARVSPAVLATVLLHPGVMGIALALNARLILGEDFDWVVSTVTASTVVAEVVAAFLPDPVGEDV